MLKFKVGDIVKVVSGKAKGKVGTIEKVFPKKSSVLIANVNMYKKHVKGEPGGQGRKGGIYDIPRPLPFSKIMLIDPKTKKPTRVGFKTVGGKKVRFAKKSGKIIKAESKKK